MSDPPREIQYGCRRGRVKRVLSESAVVKKVPRMVQRHNDHNETPKQVNGLNSFILCKRRRNSQILHLATNCRNPKIRISKSEHGPFRISDFVFRICLLILQRIVITQRLQKLMIRVHIVVHLQRTGRMQHCFIKHYYIDGFSPFESG